MSFEDYARAERELTRRPIPWPLKAFAIFMAACAAVWALGWAIDWVNTTWPI
ncbi:MAG: hypothetical protein GWO44_04590 [Thermoplasmata archaeon]|nr:hypothetical protein [Thermoplasmata archaeon]NIY02570.1 hypothetical protein [Thermoplasmata archaeon]